MIALFLCIPCMLPRFSVVIITTFRISVVVIIIAEYSVCLSARFILFECYRCNVLYSLEMILLYQRATWQSF